MNLEALLAKLPMHEQESLLAQVQTYREAVDREKAQKSFMAYVRMMWPGFVSGRHHAVMGKKFEEIADGKLKRLIICLAPRHTKSEFGSFLLPSWFLGRFPNKKIIQTSNTADLAVGFGRKVRNIVDSEQYTKVFPDVGLRQDSKSAGRWATNKNGEYFAIGVGGTVTGKGADLLIIDDPHSEQEAKAAASNPEIFDTTYEWYTSGPRQRLQPGGAIVIIMCMTGDTPVLMADGVEKPLQDIRAGDVVATFDEGKLTTAEVKNWKSSGVDSIYKVKTQSGRILRANERHPFLVLNNGVLEWTRLNQLLVGDSLVSMKDVSDLQKQSQNQECAKPAQQKRLTTEKIQMPLDNQSGTMESGKEKTASAGNLCIARGCASNATENSTRHQKELQNKKERRESSIGMASLLSNTSKWWKSVKTYVTSAVSHLQMKTHERTGTTSYASTTTIAPERLEAFSAMIATLQSVTEKHQIFSNELQRISDFTTDVIVSITPDGKEEVFDVEIDRTENFIANGVVSHNTRWSKRDLVGRILKDAMSRGKDEEWEIIEFPAIMPSGNPLWPEFWSLKELEALREELPASKWNAQYQQNPTSEEGAIVKREWWKVWEKDDPPPCFYIIQSWDTAFTKGERSDYSACTTWGLFKLNDDENDVNIILLDAFQKRMEFPELKAKAFEMYKEWEPDTCIIEAKAAGAPLVFEMRATGLPVVEYTPSRGTKSAPNDKIARLNSISDVFSSGKVWAPETRWADEVRDQIAAFPNSDHDDLTDSSVQAIMRFRQGGFIRLNSDEREEQHFRRKMSYY